MQQGLGKGTPNSITTSMIYRTANALLQTAFLVDHKNDCFKMDFTLYLNEKDPVRKATSEIAQYIRWMEHQYHHASTSRLNIDEYPKDD